MILDGKTEKDTEVIKTLGDVRQVIVFKTNKDNKIREIDTKLLGENEDSASTLVETVQPNRAAELRYKNASKAFSNKMIVDDEAVFFLMPPESDKMNTELYEIIGTQYFRNDDYYIIGGYNLGENRGMTDIVTVELKDETKANDNTSLFILDYIADAITEDGDIKQLVHGYRDGIDVEFYVESDDVFQVFRKEMQGDEEVKIPYTPVSGDILKLGFNSKNEIKIVEPIYSVAEDRMWVTNPTYENFDHVFRVVCGYMYLRDDFIGKVVLKNPNTETIQPGDFMELYNLEKFKIYRVTLDRNGKEAQKIERAAAGDVLDYVHNGTSCSRVVLHTRYGEAKTMVIYE